MKTLFAVLIVALVIHALAFVGLLIYGATTNRFDAEKREQYLATWRGEKLVPPAPVDAVEEESESPQEAAARIAETEATREILTLEIDRRFELLRSMRTAVKAAQVSVDKEQGRLDAAKEEDERVRRERNSAERQKAFAKQLDFFSRMKPKLARDHFMNMPETKVARLLAAMRPDTAKKILNSFKTDEEREKLLRVIDLIESLNVAEKTVGQESSG